MKHRIRARIRNRLPEIPESWANSFLGFVAVVIVVYALIFYIGPAIEAAMEQ